MNEIFVLTHPTRLIEKIKYELFGTLPAFGGEKIRFDVAGVVLSNGDSCQMIPPNTVVRIIMNSGYKETVAEVQAANATNAADQLRKIMMPEEDIEPIPPTGDPRAMYG